MSTPWKLKEGVVISPETAEEVAKIACALQSLAAFTSMAYEDKDKPAELQPLVDDGLQAMKKIFEW